MFSQYFKITTMHLVQCGEVSKNGTSVFSMGNEREVGRVEFLQDPSDEGVNVRSACKDPEQVERTIIELRDQGKLDPMARLAWKHMEVQVSLEGNNFEWEYYDYSN